MLRVAFVAVRKSRSKCFVGSSIWKSQQQPAQGILSETCTALCHRRSLHAAGPCRTSICSRQLGSAWAEVNQLSRQQLAAFKRRLEALEAKVAAFGRQSCVSIFFTSTGQKLLALGLPLTAAGNLVTSKSGSCASCSQARCVDALLQQDARSTLFGGLALALYNELCTALRGLYLALLFLPAAATLPLCLASGHGYAAWLDLLLWTLERAGPAFIKWGQWAATRPDLFSPQLCDKLAKLHSRAPSHPFPHTRRAVEDAFRRPLEELFAEFDPRPVASGSIAQVHRAVLTAKGASGTCYKPWTVVAVKVRHPGVSALMERDFVLMQRAAALSRRIPLLAGLQLDESVRQFGAPLRQQLDLELEARHLARFIHNFRRWHSLSFPSPIFPLVSPGVLVETFEQGRLISTMVGRPSTSQSARLANIGLHCYLQMLLKDNFVHADLHPGNILVRSADPSSLSARVSRLLNLAPPPHLVLLDVGMIAELTEADRSNLVAFFKAITSKDGRAVAGSILRFADQQTCPDPPGFVEDMRQLFDGLDPDTITRYTSEVIGGIMERIRQHQVALKGVVSTVVVTTLVLEGWSTKLDPDIKIIDTIKAILPCSFRERLTRAVDKMLREDNPRAVTLPP